ncbi:MAG: hypothetical protein Q7T48_08855 [Cellvibrio sp.]|uniref:hypothetical protein n=1 Tax=Cellvibrio sp. TaxID=1965322 RepID=UPI00271B49CA|nr:hypothetical protein [Cellvibrio sp.]
MQTPNQSRPVTRKNIGVIKINDAKIEPQQDCWSAKYCKGKILNHKDLHNCKNSGGKSWTDNFGKCASII